MTVAVANTEKWLWWDWVTSHPEDIATALRQHLFFTVVSVLCGLVLSLPLGVLAARRQRLRTAILGVTGAVYTIPSLALFAILVPYFGLSRITVVIPLTGYTLLILVRNIVAGLDSVPADIKESADGMGYTAFARLVKVELPLALPAVMAGVRIATVSTIGLCTIAAIAGLGGLGQLIVTGLNRPMRTAVTVGAVLSVALAVAADLVLGTVQRRLSPWAGEGR